MPPIKEICAESAAKLRSPSVFSCSQAAVFSLAGIEDQLCE
jgi:hypothetical protein